MGCHFLNNRRLHHPLVNRQKIQLLLVVNSRHSKRKKLLFPRNQLQAENLVERSVVGEEESQVQEKDLMMLVICLTIIVKMFIRALF